MRENLQQQIVLNSFLQSHLTGLDIEKDKHLFVWDSESFFEDVFLYFDGDVELNFSGVEFGKDYLNLKFYCFTQEEELTDIYVKNLSINGRIAIKRKYIGSVSNCEYDYMRINICGTNDIAYDDFSIIELTLEVLTKGYEPEESCKLYIICNTDLQIFAIKLGPEKELLRFKNEEKE